MRYLLSSASSVQPSNLSSISNCIESSISSAPWLLLTAKKALATVLGIKQRMSEAALERMRRASSGDGGGGGGGPRLLLGKMRTRICRRRGGIRADENSRVEIVW